MTIHFSDDLVTLHHGDCLDVLRTLPNNSVDAVVTDPPYGLEFMGKDWDAPWKQTDALAAGRMARETEGAVIDDPADVGGFQDGNGGNAFSRSRVRYGMGGSASLGFQIWCTDWATECLRVLKPGGHMLAFGGSRTWHRLAAAVEDAGFEIRDSIAWLYGSGFPKSMDVSKAIDKARDDTIEIRRVQQFLNQVRLERGLSLKSVNQRFGFRQTGGGPASKWMTNSNSPAVPTVDQWKILKEWMYFDDSLDALVTDLNARKGEGSEEWNSRPEAEYTGRPGMADSWRAGDGWTGTASKAGLPVRPEAQSWAGWGTALKPAFEPIVVGRKPLAGTVAVNVLEHGTGALNIDGCRTETYSDGPGSTPEAADGGRRTAMAGDMDRVAYDGSRGRWPTNVLLDDHQAAELDQQSGTLTSGTMRAGTERQPRTGGTIYGADARSFTPADTYGDSGGASRFFPVFRYQAKAATSERPNVDGVQHPTVKPIDLMRWLVRLVTPPGATVLEPFAGSGTTAEACVLENRRCIAIEREADYLPLIVSRLKKPTQGGLFDLGGEAS